MKNIFKLTFCTAPQRFYHAHIFFSWIFIALLLPGLVKAYGTPIITGANPTLKSVLQADGTLPAGLHGSFDAKGYIVTTGSNGKPEFHSKADNERQKRGSNTIKQQLAVNVGTDGDVRALVVDAIGNLYIGGNFNFVGGVRVNKVAKWDGSAWSALGTGFKYIHPTSNLPDTAYVTTMCIGPGGFLYAGGPFNRAGGVPIGDVAMWTGTTWTSLGGGVPAIPLTLISANGGSLYVGTDIDSRLGHGHVYNWNGATWVSVGGSFGGGVTSLASGGGNLMYACGWFSYVLNNSGIRVDLTQGIAKWNGTTWAPMPVASSIGPDANFSSLTMNGAPYALVHGLLSGSTSPVSNVATWNGTSWSPIGGNTRDTYYNLTATGGGLYAGTTGTMTGVASYSGSWSLLGTGMSPGGGIGAIAGTGSGGIYAGGQFATAGGVVVNNIARWDGTAWAALGTVPQLRAYHLTQLGNSNSRSLLNTRSGVVKVGADNTEATLFSFSRTSRQNLTLRLRENPNHDVAHDVALDDAVGYLGPITTTATTIEAVYHHPAFVDASTWHSDHHLELLDNTISNAPVVLGTYLVQAVQPPLLLVHGLWSSGAEAFPSLPAKLVTDGVYQDASQIIYADYNGAATLAANAQEFINHKNKALVTYADQNISVSKVDLVGHSMGGLMSRYYIQGPTYRQDVNKLITLNTPHSGSPIPNFINGRSGVFINVMKWMGMDPTKGAVADLSYNGNTPNLIPVPGTNVSAIRLLNGPFNSLVNMQGVAVHAITTTSAPGVAQTVQQLIAGHNDWKGLLVGWMVLSHPAATNAINAYLTNSVYHSDHDFIVGLNSQQGGLLPPYTYNFTAQDHSSGGNPTVQNDIESLLRANSHSASGATNRFTTGGLRPATLTSIFLRPSTKKSALKIASTLQITSPTRNSLATNVDSIQVAVAASADVTRVMLICGTGTSQIRAKLINGAGGTAYIQVPKGGLERLQIAAFAFADSVYTQFDTLSTRLTTTATLQSIRVEPRLVYMPLGDSARITVNGVFSDGVTRSLMVQSGMQFLFPGGNASMSRNNWAVGLRVGRDSMRVTYAGHTDLVPVAVRTAPPSGLLPTLISFTPTASNTGMTVILTGTNFTGATAVNFNGLTAPGFVVNSPSQITVQVPNSATTGPISVTTAIGMATSAGNYIVSCNPLGNYNLVGNASVNANCYTLTRNNQTYTIGGAWNVRPITLASDFDLRFNVSQCGTADGMLFVLQNAGASATSGQDGGDKGYFHGNTAFAHSLAVQLEVFNVRTVGLFANQNTTPLLPTVSVPGLNDCSARPMRLTWNRSSHTFQVYLSGVLLLTYTADIVNTLFNGNPAVTYGFVGATGGLAATQIFCPTMQIASPASGGLSSTASSSTLVLGQTIALSVNTPQPNSVYRWAGPGLRSTTGPSVTAVPTSVGSATYTVTATDTLNAVGNCSPVSQVTITVTAPLVSLTKILQSKVQLYPNPTRASVELDVPVITGATEVEVIMNDALGRIVRHHKLPLARAGVPMQLDLTGLPSGVYTVRVIVAEQATIHRLVVY